MILLLTPTEKERELVLSNASASWPEIHLCGFGAVAAAARTAALIGRYKPQHVLLLGIAGSLRTEAVVGQAYMFESVGCYGIGVGSGAAFQAAEPMGWLQWPQEPIVRDVLKLEYGQTENGHTEPVPSKHILSALVTVTATSANTAEAEQKRNCYPQGAAEDMEGFGVALACRLQEVPLTIVRGISNVAGERDHRQWQVKAAMQAATSLTDGILTGGWLDGGH